MKACAIVILAANALLLLTESKSISQPQPSKVKRTKRSWDEPFQTEKRDELLNALNGLERSRRRFEPDQGNQYLNPMAYMFDGSLGNGDEYEKSPYDPSDRYDDNEMRKKSEYSPFRTYPRPADMAELEDILASPSKAKAKAKRPDWGSSEENNLDDNYMPEEDVVDVAENEEEVNPARAQFTRDQLESLLRKAEEYEEQAVEKEKAEIAAAESTVEPVSEEELENVFAGDEEKTDEEPEPDREEAAATYLEDSDENDVRENDFPKFSPNMAQINKEWLINQYLKAAGEEASKKHKRVAKRPMDESPEMEDIPPLDAEEEEQELEAEAEEQAPKYTKKDLENLVEEYAIENKLISKENEYLATALNAATLGQIEKTDRYLDQQYKALQSAVKVEESLQDIKQAEEEEEEDEEGPVAKRFSKKTDTEFDDVIDDMPVSQVKSFPAKEDKGEWFDKPLPEGYDLVDEDSPEFTQLNPFLRKMIKIYGPEKAKELLTKRGGEPEMVPIQVEEEDVPSDSEIEEAIAQTMREKEEEEDEDEEQEAEENEIASTLEGLISNMAPQQKVHLKEQIADLVGNPKDVCPAIETLADGCENLMRLYSVDLDEEAKGVCTRHKVCYACGSSIDSGRLSRDNCDKLFLREAERRCRGEDSCKEGASGLFLLMDREHSYIDDPSKTTSEICNRECVAKYILGIE